MAIQAPQYPAPIAPSFQSFAERQRMAIDDALAAAEAQEERVYGVAKEGAKAGYEYDKMLRGYMEAKYANPNLTFWEYSTKPSVAGAYRAEGRKQIAEHISGGGDIKDIPGMTFGARHKAGLRGIVRADKREREARLAEIAKDEPRVQKMAKQELESLKDIGKDLDPEQLLSKSAGKKPVVAGEAVKEFIFDPRNKLLNYAQQKGVWKAGGGLQEAVEVTPGSSQAVTVAETAVTGGAGEAAKGGLKEALGKGVAGVGYAASIGAGISKLQSKDETAQLGGAIQTAGGVAGLVAMTNFWNPVGWAAAIPAVLSVGGGLMGAGGGTDPLAGTPLGRYRRRVGIR